MLEGHNPPQRFSFQQMFLSFSAASAKLPRMKALCEARASADSPQNEGWAPIHIASRHGHAPWRTASLSMTAQLKWMDNFSENSCVLFNAYTTFNSKRPNKIIPTHGVPFQNISPLFLGDSLIRPTSSSSYWIWASTRMCVWMVVGQRRTSPPGPINKPCWQCWMVGHMGGRKGGYGNPWHIGWVRCHLAGLG